MSYTVTLADGTKLKNLEKNGDNFIAKTQIPDSTFEGNLKTVTITDGSTTETLHDAVLVQNTDYGDGKSWFILAEKPQEQKEKEQLQRELIDTQLALVEVYEILISLGGN